MDANVIKNGILAWLAVFGSFAANALGGWDASLQVLIALMVADYITGVLVAAVWHKSSKSSSGTLNSVAGFKGILKKCAILLLVWIGVLLDNATGANYIRTAVVLFFIGNEGISLLEHLGLMGVPFPAFLQRALEALRDKGDKGNEGGN